MHPWCAGYCIIVLRNSLVDFLIAPLLVSWKSYRITFATLAWWSLAVFLKFLSHLGLWVHFSCSYRRIVMVLSWVGSKSLHQFWEFQIFLAVLLACLFLAPLKYFCSPKQPFSLSCFQYISEKVNIHKISYIELWLH